MRWIQAGVWTLLALGACGGGGLTVEQLETAQGEVHAFQPWSEAEAKLATLGEPAEKTDESMSWIGKGAEGCKKLVVTKMGTSVGTVALEPADCP